MDEKKPDAQPELSNKQVALGCSALIAVVFLVGFVIWYGVVLTKVAHSPDPDAELAKRPVFRAAYNAYGYMRDLMRPSFVPERETVMPNGAKKLPDGTWSAPTTSESARGETSP